MFPVEAVEFLADCYGTRDRIAYLCTLTDQSEAGIPDISDARQRWTLMWQRWRDGGDPDFHALVSAAAREFPGNEPLANWLETAGRSSVPGRSPPDRIDFYEDIRLPDESRYVKRCVYDSLRATLLADEEVSLAFVSGPGAGREEPTALHGMGGIGKTVLARALCDDPLVQARFPDGILWTTLGQEASQDPRRLLKLQAEWIRVLGGSVSEQLPSVRVRRQRLAQLLGQRACLLVLDDAWDRESLEAFRVAGPHSRTLITTRNAAIARSFGCRIERIRPMEEDEAIQLLERSSQGALAAHPAPIKLEIASELAFLPMALTLAGAQLRWEEPAQWLKRLRVKRLDALDTEPLEIEHRLRPTFELSVEDLPDATRVQYEELGIFPEDEAIPVETLGRLWGLGQGELQRRIESLADRALFALDETRERVELHDLLRELLQERLIPARTAAIHARLLTAYRGGTGDWAGVPDDGYLYDHLAWHLRSAERIEELRGLLREPSWLQARMQQCGGEYDGYLADLSLARRSVQSLARAELAGQGGCSALADLLRYALIEGGMIALAVDCPAELAGAALRFGCWTSSQALSTVRRMPDPLQRAKGCAALLCSDQLTPQEAQGVLRLGLQAARDATRLQRSEAVRVIAPFLSASDRESVLRWAQETPEPAERCDILEALAPHVVGDELAGRLLAASSQQELPLHRYRVLAAFLRRPRAGDLSRIARDACDGLGGPRKRTLLRLLADASPADPGADVRSSLSGPPTEELTREALRGLASQDDAKLWRGTLTTLLDRRAVALDPNRSILRRWWSLPGRLRTRLSPERALSRLQRAFDRNVGDTWLDMRGLFWDLPELLSHQEAEFHRRAEDVSSRCSDRVNRFLLFVVLRARYSWSLDLRARVRGCLVDLLSAEPGLPRPRLLRLLAWPEALDALAFPPQWLGELVQVVVEVGGRRGQSGRGVEDSQGWPTSDKARASLRRQERWGFTKRWLRPAGAFVLLSLFLTSIPAINRSLADNRLADRMREGELQYRSRLSSVPDDIAVLLATTRFDILDLSRVESLSPEAARILAHTRSPVLALTGLDRPDQAVLRRLLPYRGKLQLAPAVHTALDVIVLDEARQGTCLHLRHLSKLPSESARVLAEAEVEQLSLAGLKRLTPAAAHELARAQAQDLVLSGLKELSPGAGTALATFQGKLDLSGLEALSEEFVATLSEAQACELRLNGLKELDPPAARALAGQRDYLGLMGLSTLTPELAAELAASQTDYLDLAGLRLLSPESALALAAFQGMLDLDGLRHLSEETAAALGTASAKTLWLGGLRKLPLPVARALLPYRGRLGLRGHRSLSRELAAELARAQAAVLDFEGAQELTADVASALASYEGSLNFSGLRRFSPGVAAALGRVKAKYLWLNGFRQLPPVAARALASYRGQLGLRGHVVLSAELAAELGRSRANYLLLDELQDLSPGSAAALAPYEGKLELSGLEHLSAETAAALATARAREIWLGGLQDLAPGTARTLASYPGELGLRGHSALSPALATELARSQARFLDLDGVEALSPESAAALAPYKGKLDLGGLKHLSPEVAAALARARAKELWLNGLQDLEPGAARALTGYGGSLGLKGHSILSPELAAALSRSQASYLGLDAVQELSSESAAALTPYPGKLDLDGLADLSLETAAALAEAQAKSLYLNGLRDLAPEAARALANYRGYLGLKGHSILSPELAAALSCSQADYIHLDGVEALSPESAAAFVPYAGRLDLSGLAHLSSEAAAALAKTRAKELWLNGLQDLEPGAARALAGYGGSLGLRGHSTLSPELAAALSRSQASYLGVDAVQELSSESAAALVPYAGRLDLGGLTDLSLETAAALAETRAKRFYLNGLRDLAPKAARALAMYRGHLGLRGHSALPPELARELARSQAEYLDLDGVEALSLESAAALVPYAGRLDLGGLARLSAETAAALAKARAKELWLNGLQDLEPGAARALAGYGGSLGLRGHSTLSPELAAALSRSQSSYLGLDAMQELSLESAEALAPYLGKLDLGGLADLSLETAAALAESQAKRLYLNGLRDLAPQAARALGNYRGHLSLRGHSTLSPELAAALSHSQADYLDLDGVQELSPETALALAPFSGGRLDLGGLKVLSPDVIAALDQAQAKLRFSSGLKLSPALELLSPALLRVLAKSGLGKLELTSITGLSPDVGDELTRYSGHLDLSGLVELPAPSAQLLGRSSASALDLSGLDQLSPAAAKALAGFSGRLDLSGLAKLSAEVVAALADFSGRLDLSGLAELSAETASALARIPGRIDLSGLQELSPEAATALARFSHRLDLSGIRKLTPQVAAALAGSKSLALSGLQELSPEVAAMLAGSRSLDLSGLQELSPEAVAALGGFSQRLDLSGLQELSPELAAALAGLTFSDLSRPQPTPGVADVIAGSRVLALSGLQELSPEAATALAGFSGSLELSGLRELSPEAATALAGSQRPSPSDSEASSETATPLGSRSLDLSGLKRLSPRAARALADYSGSLFLWHLESLSDAAAAELARFRGLLLTAKAARRVLAPHLQSRIEEEIRAGDFNRHDELTTLPTSIARLLASAELEQLGFMRLTRLSPEAAAALVPHEGVLTFSGLEQLPPEVAEALASCRARRLSLFLKQLSEPSEQALARFCGELWLFSLQGLSTPQLARRLGVSHLYLPSISPAACAALSRDFRLNLSRMPTAELTPALLEVLAARPKRLLTLSPETEAALAPYRSRHAIAALDRGRLDALDLLAEVSPESATRLADSGLDRLPLSAVERLSPAAARALARHPGSLRLDALSALPPAVAKALCSGRAALISLVGLEELEPAVLRELASFEGMLRLPPQWMDTLAEQRDEAALDAIAAGKTRRHRFLTRVTAEAAEQLAATCQDTIELDAVRSLSPEAARLLARASAHQLSLGGLSELSAPLAEALSSYSGHLRLTGLNTLSAESARLLSEGRLTGLSLGELTRLSAAAARALASFRGELVLPGWRQAKILSLQGRESLLQAAQRGGAARLHLERVVSLWQDLSPGEADLLAELELETLDLSRLQELSPEAARSLARGRARRLEFAALQAVSEEAGRALVAFAGPLEVPPAVRQDLARLRGVELTKATEKSPADARLPTLPPRVAGNLDLSRFDLSIAQVSSEQVPHLMSCGGPLRLVGSALTVDQARRLARAQAGRLELACSVSPVAVAALAPFPGEIVLPRWRLTPALAEALADLEASRLTLPGLRYAGRRALTALARFRGTLVFPDLELRLERIPPSLLERMCSGPADEPLAFKAVTLPPESLPVLIASRRPLALELDDLAPEAARQLATSRSSRLSLQVRAPLSREALAALGGFRGELALEFPLLSGPIGEALGRAKASGLDLAAPFLSPAGAAGLAGYPGELRLRSLRGLPGAAATALGDSRATALTIEAEVFHAALLAGLAGYPGALTLAPTRTQRLSGDLAQALAETRARALTLRGFGGISPEAARRLAARADGLSWEFSSLTRLELESVVAVAAAHLSLRLSTPLSEDVARLLANAPARALSVSGEASARREGPLPLELRPARLLVRFPGRLTLQLDRLDRPLAQVLGAAQTDQLVLRGAGLRRLSPSLAQELASYSGKRLEVASLCAPSRALAETLAQSRAQVLALPDLRCERSSAAFQALSSFPGVLESGRPKPRGDEEGSGGPR